MRRPKVVVVEDDGMNMLLFQEILDMHGYEAVCSMDGSDLEDLIASAAPVAVILDIQLPGQSGIDLLRRLRGNPETATLPVHAVTAHGDTYGMAIKREDFTSVLSKPVNMAALIDAVGGVAGRPAV